MRVYATPADLTDYTGEAAPANAEQLLARASRMLEAQVFRLCWYEADDTTGLPTNTLVSEAFRDAVCAQAEWWDDVGDVTGASAAGWGHVEIGTVRLGRSLTTTSAQDSPARQIAPGVWDALGNADLTPDVFRLGAVTAC